MIPVLQRAKNSCVFLIFLLTVSWCTGTETGNPPAINPDAIYIQKADVGVRMAGEDGAVTPGNSELRIVNLDMVSEPVDIQVNMDGSFQVDLDGEFDHIFRLRARVDDDRSKPVNISGESIETNDCVQAEPVDTVTFPKTDPSQNSKATIVLTNRCDKDVVLVEQRIRIRAASIELPDLDLPLTIEAGESLTIDATFSPSKGGTFESIVMYGFDSPGRIILDLVGVATQSAGVPSGSPNDPMLSGVRAQLGVCYGANTECDNLPAPISSGYPAVKTTTNLAATSETSIDWIKGIESVDCPFPPCYLYQPRLAVAPDGSVSVAAKVAIAGELFDDSRESGVWLGRYSEYSELIHQEIVDFNISTTVGFWRNAPSIAVDSRGVTYLANLVQLYPYEDTNEERYEEVAHDGELSIYQYDDQGKLLGIPITRYGLQGAAIFVDPKDNIVLVTHYRNPDVTEPVMSTDHNYSSGYFDSLIPIRVDVSKYDSNGTLIWNQAGLNGSAAYSRIMDLGIDADGNMVAAIRQIVKDQERTWTLVRLSEDGNIDWMRPLTDPEHGRIGEVSISVDPNGNVSVLNSVEVLSLYDEVDDDVKGDDWETGEILLDRFSPNGGAQWTWNINRVSLPYGDFTPLIKSDSRGVSLLVDYFEAGSVDEVTDTEDYKTEGHILRFSSDGTDIAVSNISQVNCLGEGPNYEHHEIIDAAVCSGLTLELSITDQLYFTSEFGGEADAIEEEFVSDDGIPGSVYSWSSFGGIRIESVIAFGRLSDAME